MTVEKNNPALPPPTRRFVSILKKVLLGLVLLVVAFVIIVALQPTDYRVVRSTTIAAPPAAVFAQVNDFHAWKAWSPWAKLDPAAKNSFEGAPWGTGAIFKWSGNDQIGEGTMTMTESHPTDLIRIRLDFVKPYAGTSNAEFTFKPDGDKTLVTWSMAGHNNFMAKVVCLFMNMDKMLGGEFERGLAHLKTIAETPPPR